MLWGPSSITDEPASSAIVILASGSMVKANHGSARIALCGSFVLGAVKSVVIVLVGTLVKAKARYEV